MLSGRGGDDGRRNGGGPGVGLDREGLGQEMPARVQNARSMPSPQPA